MMDNIYRNCCKFIVCIRLIVEKCTEITLKSNIYFHLLHINSEECQIGEKRGKVIKKGSGPRQFGIDIL